jgi:hypothetical protein
MEIGKKLAMVQSRSSIQTRVNEALSALDRLLGWLFYERRPTAYA